MLIHRVLPKAAINKVVNNPTQVVLNKVDLHHNSRAAMVDLLSKHLKTLVRIETSSRQQFKKKDYRISIHQVIP